MRVGLVYEFSNPPQWRVDPKLHFARQLEQMVWAEQLGVDGIWMGEHHFWEDDYLPSPVPLMAAAAAKTSRVKIGCSVLLPAFRHPVQLAEDLALIDIISGGRLEVAFGLGWAEKEFRTFGVDPKTRVGRFHETIDIIQRAWSDEECAYEGKYYRFPAIDVRPKPIQKPPKIWAGASAPQGGHRIGRSGLPMAWMEADVFEAFREGRREAGLSISDADCAVGGYIWMFICDDPEATWRSIKPYFDFNVLRYKHAGRVPPDQASLPDIETRFDARTQSNFWLLTPEEAIEEMTRRAEHVPIENFVTPANLGGAPEHFCNRHVELLATVVAPALKHVGINTQN